MGDKMYDYYYEDVYDKYEKAKEQFEHEFPYESFISEEEFINEYYNLHEDD
jgi:hypothetical protein